MRFKNLRIFVGATILISLLVIGNIIVVGLVQERLQKQQDVEMDTQKPINQAVITIPENKTPANASPQPPKPATPAPTVVTPTPAPKPRRTRAS